MVITESLMCTKGERVGVAKSAANPSAAARRTVGAICGSPEGVGR